MKLTDVPWRAVNHPYAGRNNETLDDWCVEDATGERIVEVYKSDGLDEATEFPANARAHLIAAAPEMYEACKAVWNARRLPEECSHDSEPDICDACRYAMEINLNTAITKVAAALGKADGR